LLTVELGLLVVLFGSHFKAGWRSHTQKIVIGLSTAAITLLIIETTVQSMIRTARAHPLNQEGYQRIVGLLGKFTNANRVVYIIVLLWWIAWLWFDEPGTPETAAIETAAEQETTQE
jgi:uncharacterized membrane protein YuzA (DUF378 family)